MTYPYTRSWNDWRLGYLNMPFQLLRWQGFKLHRQTVM